MAIAGMQYSFNSGEWSPEFGGRVDLGKYASSCRLIRNFVPRVMGSLKKRPGTRYVGPARSHTLAARTRLVPFVFSNVQAYMLEFGDGFVRIYRNGARVESGGLPVEFAVPYASSEIYQLQWVQSADVLYLAHPDHPPRKITRTSDTAWTTQEIDFAWPAFRPENITADTITASAVTGVGITLTASVATFTADMVGSYVRLRELIASENNWPWVADNDSTTFRTGGLLVNDFCYFGQNVYQLTTKTGLKSGTKPPIHTSGVRNDGYTANKWDWTYLHSGSGYVKITGFASSTVVTGDVVSRLPQSALTPGTSLWAIGAWSDEYGYPRSVAFYEDRLWWAGTDTDPQSMWASQVSDYENHRIQNDDLSGMLFTLSEDESNVIAWITGSKVLGIGTAGAEFIAVGADGEKPITPSNPMKATSHNKLGSLDYHKPVKIDSVFVFPQRSARSFHELVYDFGTDSYVAPDLNLLADHILLEGIAEFAWQLEPDRLLWVVVDDGTLRTFTYDRSQEVAGWARHAISGTGAFVESVGVIPHPDGDQDQVWIAVRRTINGATFRSIETLEKPWDRGDNLDLYGGLDAMLSRTGAAPVSTLTGYTHLIGQTVWAWADSQIQGPFVVSALGEIALTTPATEVTAGLQYDCEVIPARPHVELKTGASSGARQSASRAMLRLDQCGPGLFSRGAHEAGELSPWDPITMRTTYDELGQELPLFDGDLEPFVVNGGWTRDGAVRIKHSSPAPCSILAIMPEHSIGSR